MIFFSRNGNNNTHNSNILTKLLPEICLVETFLTVSATVQNHIRNQNKNKSSKQKPKRKT